MKHLRAAAILTGLAVYAVAFYMTPLPGLGGDRPPWRIDLLFQLLLRPDAWLFPNWFGTPPQFSLVDRLPVLLVAGTVLAWAAAIGWLLVTACRWSHGLTRLETTLFSMAVGLNILSTWVLLLGLFGQLGRTWVFTVPAVATCIAMIGAWFRREPWDGHQAKGFAHPKNSRRLTDSGKAIREKIVTAPRSLLASGCWNDQTIVDPRWLWLALPFVMIIVLAAMLPPLDFDVCEYHLQGPKEFFQQGHIAFLPHNVYANMAMGTEMLSLLAMVVAGDWWLGALAGKTVIAVFTPLCALALVAAGRRFFNSTGVGVVAALVYVSIPWITSISSAGLVEGALACYLFLAVYAILLPDRQEYETAEPSSARSACAPSHLALAGYLVGGAVATKYPAVLFVLLPLAVWVLWRRRSAKALGVFLLAAAVGCGLWFGKNWVLTGNPTYPLLYEVFDGRTWNADKQQQWNAVHRPHDFSPKALGNDLGRVLLTSPWLSPLVIPLALLALVGGSGATDNRRLAWQLLVYAGFVIAVWWLFTHRIDRFWLPVLPILALLAGVGACWSSARWWRGLFLGLLLLGLGANFLVASAGQSNAWFVPLEQLRNDPQWTNPWHRFFNTHAAEDTVLTVGDAAVFDLKPPVLYNTCFDDCIFQQIVEDKSVSEIRAELASRKIAFVYVHWGEIARYRSPGNYGFSAFVWPEVFDRLAEQGILEPLPSIEGDPGRGYRVEVENREDPGRSGGLPEDRLK